MMPEHISHPSLATPGSGPATPARLVIADDHPLVRAALSSLLRADPAVEVIEEVGDFRSLFDVVARALPDLVLMDVKMPGGDGVDAVRRLKVRYPEVSILVLSGLPEEELVLRVVRAGASGYVEKDSSPTEIHRAIHTVLAGGFHVGPAGSKALARAAGPTGSGRDHDVLSDREFQVLGLLGEGLQVGEIATRLSLSPKTVSTYRTRIMTKMDLKGTAEIIRYAIQHGLTD